MADSLPGPTPFLIGVAGGTASGKTSVCRKIMAQLNKDVPVSSPPNTPILLGYSYMRLQAAGT